MELGLTFFSPAASRDSLSATLQASGPGSPGPMVPHHTISVDQASSSVFWLGSYFSSILEPLTPWLKGWARIGQNPSNPVHAPSHRYILTLAFLAIDSWLSKFSITARPPSALPSLGHGEVQGAPIRE